jgi:peptide/nickel transport system permease protein
MAQLEGTFPEKEVSKARSFWLDVFVRLVREKPLGTVGGIIVLALLITGICASWILTLRGYGYNDIFVGPKLAAPSLAFPFGCDQLGRDVLSRVIYGARVSVIVGLSVAGISVAISTAIGIVCGYIGGKVDLIGQRIVDGVMCIPGLFLILTFLAIFPPPGGNLLKAVLPVTLVLGILFGIGQSRIVRGAVIGIRANPYLEAARAIGCGTRRILLKHVLPNVLAPIIILFTITVGAAILIEASISFLGFGIPPPFPTWGGMLSMEGRRYMLQAPFLAFWPGFFLAIVVWGVNMLGDALRDLFDPRLRGGLGRYR